MRFYTVQHKDVWEHLQKIGEYRTNEKFICEESFLPAYNWLNSQAKKRIKEWNTERPVWLWVKKPDLRTYRFIKNPDEPKVQDYVLIELEIPANEVLISEFGLWHHVLNNSYIAYTKKEDEEFDEQLEKTSSQEIQKKIEQSWEKCIVDESLKCSNKFEEYCLGETSFQAIVSCLKIDQVVSHKKFKMINTYKNRSK